MCSFIGVDNLSNTSTLNLNPENLVHGITTSYQSDFKRKCPSRDDTYADNSGDNDDIGNNNEDYNENSNIDHRNQEFPSTSLAS